MSKAVGLCARAFLALALTVAFGSGTALAAGSGDTGWYDPQSPGAARPSTAPPPAAPPAAAGPQLQDEPPSLPPSPLLDRGGDAPPPAGSASTQEDRDPRALEDFRPTLDPYGTWLQHPSYGTVWVPSPRVVGSEFSPYVSAGRWALDDQNNWTWVSDYPFGGVVFHYGRWVWIGGTGWAWVPGYQYAPAWVDWRVPTGSYAYVGWAPMGPSFVWYGGFAVSFWYGVYTPYYYCSSYYAFYPHVHHYVVHDPAHAAHAHDQTRPYVPASGVGAHPTVQRSPSMADAHVPSSAVPRARVPSSMPPTSGAGMRSASFGARQFSSSGMRPGSARVPSPTQAARFRTPEPASRGAADPSRFRAQHTPVAPRSYTPPTSTRRSSPTPSSATPSFSPSTTSAGRSYSPSSTRSISPSPSIPRSFSPSPSSSHSFSPSGGGRSFSPGGGRSHGPR